MRQPPTVQTTLAARRICEGLLTARRVSTVDDAVLIGSPSPCAGPSCPPSTQPPAKLFEEVEVGRPPRPGRIPVCAQKLTATLSVGPSHPLSPIYAAALTPA